MFFLIYCAQNWPDGPRAQRSKHFNTPRTILHGKERRRGLLLAERSLTFAVCVVPEITRRCCAMQQRNEEAAAVASVNRADIAERVPHSIFVQRLPMKLEPGSDGIAIA